MLTAHMRSSVTDQTSSGQNYPDFLSPSLQLYPFAAQPHDSVTQQLLNFPSLALQSPTAFSPLQTLLKQEPPGDASMPGLMYPLSQEGSPTDYSTSYFYSTSHPQTPASSSESPQPVSATVETQFDSRADAEVVYPPPSISGLKISLPSIPLVGAKSRVETQIKVIVQLTMPDGDPLAGRRVGTWKWIKLEKGAALRKRPRNAAKNISEPKPSEVLQLVATVHPASQPSLTAYRCASCHQREVKRTARKLALRVRPPPSPSPSPDGHHNPKSRDNAEEELDEKRMVIFNCADLQELREGEISLPTRLVCYCRHHREKLGFM
ncbi:hypothetical protein CALCODRAFT_324105 [Calocera cornea HHB12733]|uniref:SPT23/MGA2-like DNA-binding domain-containing protein n=1 Tax=Calocera cornea HHB12733 TaxID=1353952 RepID=A0A165F445_9BASI|nr:hypothetical protein CALCODRAFT_324105 [Calocera cornea HHB12733]